MPSNEEFMSAKMKAAVFMTHWADTFAAMPRVPFTPQQIELLANLEEAEDRGMRIPSILVSDLSGNTIFMILQKRIKTLQIDITPWAVIAAAVPCTLPSDSVMMATMLKVSYVRTGRLINIARLMTTVFNGGFPNRESRDEMWVAQKLKEKTNAPSDNILDYAQSALWVAP